LFISIPMRKVLIKFGKPEHIFALYKHGELYFQNPSKWKNSDPDEMVLEYLTPGHIISITDENKNVDIRIKKGKITGQRMGVACCFYVLDLDKYNPGEPHSLSDLLRTLGESCLLIYNTDEFLNRILSQTLQEKLSFKSKELNYIEPTKHIGKKGIFEGNVRLNYENELRMYLFTDNAESRKLTIGSLEKIAKYSPDFRKLKFMIPKKD